MNEDYLEVRNAEGMPNLTDATIALDFLIAAKNGVRNCAIAITEAANSEVRAALRSQLEDALNLHEEISDLMIKKGWFYPYDINEQFKLDTKSAQTALQIASLDLFPGNTNRLGTFATPYK